MANGNNPQTPTEKLAESLTNVCSEFWKEASETFATKEEVGVSVATQAECRAIVTGYGQSS